MTATATGVRDSTAADYESELMAFVGQETGPDFEAPDEVNQAMIRHWVEAMGDTNPVYVDDAAARLHGYQGVVAPATMLQAWIMRGLTATLELEAAREAGTAPTETPNERMMALLDDGGYTSVVATNCDQHYDRPLVPGDRIRARSSIEAISEEKATGLGTGRFVTTLTEFLDAAGERVGTMRFRILKFKPNTGRSA